MYKKNAIYDIWLSIDQVCEIFIDSKVKFLVILIQYYLTAFVSLLEKETEL